jgi:ATP/ADP translocase
MNDRIYRALNIKPAESGRVFDLLSVQFFIGLANALVTIIAYSLFVYNIPIQYLPYAYLAIGLMIMVMNVFYEKLEHKLPPLDLLKYIIGFTAAALVLLWFGLSTGHQSTFIFILLVFSVLIYMVTGYAFWGLVSLLFNVRESRRVFSVVGAGDIPAKLVGYMITPLLIPLIGLTNILWLAVLCFAYALILFHRKTQKESWEQIRHKGHDAAHAHDDHEALPQHSLIRFFFDNRLIFAISLLSLISYNVFVLVDFTFISQVKLRFENISDLAIYIAVFFAFGRVIAIAFKLIFTSRMIEKLGVVSSLFITPIALFAFSLLFFVVGDSSKYSLLIFGLMTVFTEVLRSMIQEPVFFILFQPLRESLRLKGHLISKGFMYPPSLFIVGGTLCLMYYKGWPVSISFAQRILLVNLAIWALIIFYIRRTYLNTVHSSIKKGVFNSDDIYINDEKTVQILVHKIASGNRLEALYAFNLLEKSGYSGFQQLIKEQLRPGNDVTVLQYVLGRADAQGLLNPVVLHQLLAAETDETLREKIIGLLCRIDPAFLHRAALTLSREPYPIRKIMIVHLLNQREFNYLLRAGNELNNLISSPVTEERILAVETICDLKHVQFSDAISLLIHDPESPVRRAAYAAAAQLRLETLLPELFRQLHDPESRNMILKSMPLYGDRLYKDLAGLPESVQADHTIDLIKLAGKIDGPHSVNYLLKALETKDLEARQAIVQSLWQKDLEPDNNETKEQLNALLTDTLQQALEKINEYHQLPACRFETLIQRSLIAEIRQHLTVSLKLCYLLYRKTEINRILELMQLEKADKLYNGMEMLELVLPKRISKDLNQAFDFILDPAHIPAQFSKQTHESFIRKILLDAPQEYVAWTKAVGMYSSWKESDYQFWLPKAVTTGNEHALLQETREYISEQTKQAV